MKLFKTLSVAALVILIVSCSSSKGVESTLPKDPLVELNLLLDTMSDQRSIPEIKNAIALDGVNAYIGDRTVLLEALHQGYATLAVALINCGADTQGMTLVDWAAVGDVDKVSELIEAGLDVNNELSRGYFTPLMRACENGHLDVAKLLIENGARIDTGSVLVRATQSGNFDLVKYLVEQGADVNDVDAMGGAMPLWAPVRNGRLDIATYLIENGANVEAQTYSGTTTLMFACEAGQIEVVDYLIENGANVNAKDFSSEMTPLKYATENGYTEIVTLLKEAGATE